MTLAYRASGGSFSVMVWPSRVGGSTGPGQTRICPVCWQSLSYQESANWASGSMVRTAVSGPFRLTRAGPERCDVDPHAVETVVLGVGVAARELVGDVRRCPDSVVGHIRVAHGHGAGRGECGTVAGRSGCGRAERQSCRQPHCRRACAESSNATRRAHRACALRWCAPTIAERGQGRIKVAQALRVRGDLRRQESWSVQDKEKPASAFAQPGCLCVRPPEIDSGRGQDSFPKSRDQAGLATSSAVRC